MPDTLNYMIVGYILALLILGGLVVYIVARRRSLTAERDELIAMIDESAPANRP
jgi:hypothetical protein